VAILSTPIEDVTTATNLTPTPVAFNQRCG
jgi:hypothetical protein